jgi:dethiobiotin synthetase/adenosylmethionine--8-amino-7-oxononanoate aminotransferase
VFFSDDGSTAVEVALKMAFRKFMVNHQLLEQDAIHLEVEGDSRRMSVCCH